MDNLIFDRSAPVAQNAADWNRLETWTTYLAAQLRGYGYAVSVTPLLIRGVDVTIEEKEIVTPLAFTGTEQEFIVPFDGVYTITAAGAAGAGGNAYSGTPSAGGKGAKLQARFALQKGDVLRVIVGGMGTCVNATSKDGTSGGGGGCTMVLREIDAITDSRYQFTKDTPFEVLLCAAGGGGGNDSSYKGSAVNGADGEASTFKSPANFTAASTTTGTAATSAVMGIQQYIANNAVGAAYTRNNGKSQGGYGCGGAADDNPTYGGGWCAGSANYAANSWSLDETAIGTDGDNAGDGYVQLIGFGEVRTETPFERDYWTREDLPTRGEVDRIRRNVDALQAGFYSLPDWREIVYDNTMHYTQANALEWDLQRLYDWLRAMVSNFQMRQANTIFMQAGGILNA